MDINLVITTGRLATDPTISLVGDASCTSFSLASNTRLKDSEGKPVTIFYRVTAWRRLGELCAQYLKKGSHVTVSGDLSVREYRDRNGTDRTAIQINAEKIDFGALRKADRPPTPDDDALPI